MYFCYKQQPLYSETLIDVFRSTLIFTQENNLNLRDRNGTFAFYHRRFERQPVSRRQSLSAQHETLEITLRSSTRSRFNLLFSLLLRVLFFTPTQRLQCIKKSTLVRVAKPTRCNRIHKRVMNTFQRVFSARLHVLRPRGVSAVDNPTHPPFNREYTMQSRSISNETLYTECRVILDNRRDGEQTPITIIFLWYFRHAFLNLCLIFWTFYNLKHLLETILLNIFLFTWFLIFLECLLMIIRKII